MNKFTFDTIDELDQEQMTQLYLAMVYDAHMFAEVMNVDNPDWVDTPPFMIDEYKLHDDLSERKLIRGCVVEPRGFAKSVKKCLSTARDLAYRHEDVVLYTSESEPQALRDVEVNQALVESRVYQRIFGDHKGKLWNKSECFINGAYLIATGFKTRIRGIHAVIDGHEVRLTKAIADDFESEFNTRTDEQRKDVVRRIKSGLLPAGRAQGFRLLFEGTVVHPESFLAKAKDNPMFKEKYHGRYLEFQLSSDPYNIGIPTFPGLFPREKIEEIKASYLEDDSKDIWQFYQEYYNLPMITGNPKFDVNQVKPVSVTFHRYKHLTWLEYQGKKVPVNVFIGIDPASSLKKKSDNTWIVVLAVLPSGEYVILDMYWDKIHMDEQINQLMDRCKEYNPRCVTIETYGYQGELKYAFDIRMISEEQQWSVKEFQEHIGKSRKFKEGLSLDINDGKVLYCDDIKPEVVTKFKNELKLFTGTQTEKDDSIDGLYLAKIHSFAPVAFDVDEEIRRLNLIDGQYELVNHLSQYVKKSNVRRWRAR